MRIIKAILRRPYVFLLHLWQALLTSGWHLDRLALFMRVKPYTMVPFAGINNLYELSRRAEKEGVDGAFVQCGVWHGGCAAILGTAYSHAKLRHLWLFDSFEGVPEPTHVDGREASDLAGHKTSGELRPIGQFVGEEAKVHQVLSTLNVPLQTVHIQKGWFQDTLPRDKGRIGPIALLHLDGDWYESTKVCLENLYDLVMPGGFVVIDDYGHWEGCRKAVDEFFAARHLSVKLEVVNYSIRYFVKPAS